MFKLFRLANPLLSLKSLKIMLLALVLLTFYLGYSFIQNRMDKLDQANVQIEKYKNTVIDLEKNISDVKQELVKLKESNELTINILKSLQENKIQIKKKVIKKETEVIDKITLIDNDASIGESIKDLEKSKLYAEDLFNTVCELDKSHCKSEVIK